jgi:hypothetical protein
MLNSGELSTRGAAPNIGRCFSVYVSKQTNPGQKMRLRSSFTFHANGSSTTTNRLSHISMIPARPGKISRYRVFDKASWCMAWKVLTTNVREWRCASPMNTKWRQWRQSAGLRQKRYCRKNYRSVRAPTTDANCPKVSAKVYFDFDFRIRAVMYLITLRAFPAPVRSEGRESTKEARRTRRVRPRSMSSRRRAEWR